MVLSKLILKDTFIYSVLEVLNKAIPFLLLPYLARRLHTYDLGYVELFNSSNLIVSAIMGFALDAWIVSNYHKKNESEFYIGVRACIFIILTMLCILAIFLFIFMDDFFISLNTLIASLGISFTSIYIALARMQFKSTKVFCILIIQSLLNACSVVFLFEFFIVTPEVRVLTVSVSYFIVGSYCAVNLINQTMAYKFNLGCFKSVFTFSLPLIPHKISFWLRSGVDRIFISTFVSLSGLGLFSIAFQISNVLQIVLLIIVQAIMPYFMRFLSLDAVEKYKNIHLCGFLFFLFIATIGITMILTIPFWFSFAFQSQYYDSIYFARILIVGVVFSSVYNYYINVLFFYGATNLISLITVSISILHACMSYILLSFFKQIYFICLSSTFLNFALALTTLYFANKFLKRTSDVKNT